MISPDDSASERSTFKWERLLPFFIVLVGVLAYINSFSNPFIFDDRNIILSDPNIAKWWPLSFSARFIADYTFKLNYLWDGYNVAGYHVVNLLIHIVSGLLLYGIVRRTLDSSLFASGTRSSASWLAFACASIWVVHPIQTESVGYICQRYESLMGMFVLLSLYAFVRAQGSSRCHLWHDVSLVACMLGMGTKESMIVAPVAVMLYDYMFVSRSFPAMLRERWKFHAAMFATLGVGYVLHLNSVQYMLNMGQIGLKADPVSSLRYIMTQFGVILHYLRLSVIPYPLCMDYAWPVAVTWREIVPAAVVIGLLFFVTCRAISLRRPAGFLGAWFFLMLVPSSSLFPIADMAAEHRMYLAIAGVICAAILGCHRLVGFLCGGCSEKAKNLIRAAILLAVVCALTAVTISRNEDYHSAEGMLRQTVALRPTNFRAHIGLICSNLAEGNVAEAELTARLLLARVQLASEDASLRYRAVSASNPEYYLPEAHNQFGRVLLGEGKYKRAIAEFETAIRFRNDSAIFYNNLAAAMLMDGRPSDAMKMCEAAVSVDPCCEPAHAMMGDILAKQGRYAEAIQHYRASLAITPQQVDIECDLAWLLATCPDDGLRKSDEALKMARRVCDATGYGSFRALDVLAAASAGAGQFQIAMAMARKALELAGRNGAAPQSAFGDEATSKDSIAGRLRLYESGKPYRLPPAKGEPSVAPQPDGRDGGSI